MADAELVRRAAAKKRAGEKPTREEASALRAFEKDLEEKRRREYYATIPKRHWCELSGRPVKVLNEQAASYGLPVGEATIDLGKVARWLHDLLRDKGRVIKDESDAEAGPMSPALEKIREEKWLITRMERLEMEGELVRRDDLHRRDLVMADLLRGAAEKFQRLYGNDAAVVMNELVDRFEQLMQKQLAEAAT